MISTAFAFLWLATLSLGQAFSSPASPHPIPIPITVLSGFLGSGKTTLLQHLLQNNDGLKIAVIVNDVASVNIDEKLVVGGTAAPNARAGAEAKPDTVIQLSNGCACCSLSDELLSSVSELITISDLRDPTDRFDHIVIEASGVSDPRAIRGHFQDALFYNMPLMERVQLDTMVTVVDVTTYQQYLNSAKSTDEKDSPELHYRNEEEREKAKEANWMDYLPGKLAEAMGEDAIDAPTASVVDGSGVSDLLVEQTEVADIILLNKVDILEEEENVDSAAKLEEIENIVSSLNPRATILKTAFAAVDRLGDVLGAAKANGVVEAGVVDDHRDYVSAASRDEHESKSHNHSHSHNTSADCTDPECTDTSHSHNHQHGGEHIRGDCTDPECTDMSHTHTHQHGEHDDDACTDPKCTDPSHSHDHMHSDNGAVSYAGIGSFVYRARRPFHPSRLTAFLRHLPIVRGVPGCNHEEILSNEGGEITVSTAAETALKYVIRSKGFAWLADSNLAAMYWSHAGSSFEMQCLGRWWTTLPKENWPEEAKADILSDFDDANHDESDPSMPTVGDRRQEVVFIGPKLNNPCIQQCVCETLDQCLLTDDEWVTYKEKCSEEAALRSRFANILPTKMLSY